MIATAAGILRALADDGRELGEMPAAHPADHPDLAGRVQRQGFDIALQVFGHRAQGLFGQRHGIGAQIIEQQFEIGGAAAIGRGDAEQALLLDDLGGGGRGIADAEAALGAGDSYRHRVVGVFGQVGDHREGCGIEREAGCDDHAQGLADIMARAVRHDFGDHDIANHQFQALGDLRRGQIERPTAHTLGNID